MSKEIFISHAVKDKELADTLVDLLQTGLGVSADQIFCSSLESLGIPSGVNFVDHIKNEIQNPKAVLALITPNYLASQFCLCELGASWAMYHRLFPIIVSPLTFEDVKGVLAGVQLIEINNPMSLSEMRDQFNKALGVNGGMSARWEAKRDAFLKKLPKILKKLPAVDRVTATAHAKVVNELTDAKQYVADQEVELDKLKALVAELENAKDRTEVAEIKRAHSGEAEALDDLETEVGIQLEKLPRCVSYMACKEVGLGQRVVINTYKDPDLAEELERAAGQEFIEIDEGVCSLNREHPKLKKLMKSYRALVKFIDGASPTISDDFEREHQTTLSLGNSEYWGIRLDTRLQRVSF